MEVKVLLDAFDSYGIKYELNADKKDVEASIAELDRILIEQGLLQRSTPE